ncbi:S9 family peptidase [Foetidibacter luteolus]|uniref:S9 family peptidase n=1 Tax=Foetidibacter luteolus TaxID=2608880 RepID=UPI00129B159D|nr:DPP IV N-terminal domain-containing protein [Foetidibacter luteolus]
MRKQYFVLCIIQVFALQALFAQKDIKWRQDGNGYYSKEDNALVEYKLPAFTKTILVTAQQLTPTGQAQPLKVEDFFFSADGANLLIYTNSKKVWRKNTRGDYWLLNLAAKTLEQVGKGLPASSLMFAKFSPDGKKIAYVSQRNIYTEDVFTHQAQQLTTDGTDRLINGTFDWAYEEEFGCRDGFRWSPDSKSIAYWQIDATQIRNFLMINNTDSIYSFTVPVEYPKVGESPSPYKIGIVDVTTAVTRWMNIPGDPRQHYVPRMEWAAGNTELIIEQLNRKQQQSRIMLVNAVTGSARTIHEETSEAWIDCKERWNNGDPSGWEWLPDGKSFLWVSEKDGWQHIYIITRGGKETLITNGAYDVIDIKAINSAEGYIYFSASPQNATQKYLCRIAINGKQPLQMLSPKEEKGTHNYKISPTGAYAQHTFSNANTAPQINWVSLPRHNIIKEEPSAAKNKPAPVEFFQVTTQDGITMDGWMVKPLHFDSAKKYPVVFFVYTEPAGATVKDEYGSGNNKYYSGSMAADGYIYISLDGRGTPAPKGAAWRKAIYRNIGIVNVRDQAMAAMKILQWPFVDSSRIAVWGHSGGGSTTLNLLCQYPEIYKTGIAMSAVVNQLTYDNIYQERYMGLPQENLQYFVKGSPVTHAKNLRGNLLYIHGTGDDNVHYQNAELLINELVKYNKQFQLMSYPNSTHALKEGEGIALHLQTLFTQYLKAHCPPGGR